MKSTERCNRSIQIVNKKLHAANPNLLFAVMLSEQWNCETHWDLKMTHMDNGTETDDKKKGTNDGQRLTMEASVRESGMAVDLCWYPAARSEP